MRKEEKKEENFITLRIVVNTTPADVRINVNAPLKAAVEKAIEDTGNSGRPISEWTIKWNDTVLDMDKKIKEFNFPEGVELFLSPNAGIGGNV